jgi:TatA/E family protein of Tat protein translocase
VFNIGSQELLIILLLVFLFFGPRHLPEVARTLGKGLGDMQRTLRGVEDNVRKASEQTIGRSGAPPSIFDARLLEEGGSPAPATAPGEIPAAVALTTDPPGEPEPEENDPGGIGLNPS